MNYGVVLAAAAVVAVSLWAVNHGTNVGIAAVGETTIKHTQDYQKCAGNAMESGQDAHITCGSKFAPSKAATLTAPSAQSSEEAPAPAM